MLSRMWSSPRRKISLRLALYLFILNGFILIVNSTVGYTFIRDVIKRNTAYYAEHYIGSLNNELNFYFRDLELMTQSLYYINPELFYRLDEEQRQTELRKYLEGVRNGRDYIADIIVMSNDLEAVGTSPFRMDQLQRSDIYRLMMGSVGELVMTPTGYSTIFPYRGGEQPQLIFVGRKIVTGSENRGRTEGFVIVSLKAERITDIIQKREKRYDERLFLVDRRGFMMEPASIGDLPHNGEEMLKEAGGGEPSFTRFGHLIVTGNDPKSQPLNIVGIIPEEALLKDATIILKLQLALNFALLVIGMTLAFILSYHFLKPIVRLAKFMSSMGNLGSERLAPYPARSGAKDEIGLLIVSFNRMIYRLKRTSQRVEEERQKQKKAELRALQAQINPHFIYNTLNNIRWLARMGQTESIFDMLTSMNIILVSAFQLEKPIITIGEELKHLAAYVEIQQRIYPGQFSVVYELEEHVKDGKIARMSLQPLVENAIFHGILPKREAGVIWIKGWQEKERIVLKVIDSGVGAMQPVPADNPAREHVGMRNVDKRIQLYFGESYGVKWESRPGKGMTVTVILPLDKQQ
ncbi:sensor histidine kinase [Paenibacillus sp. GCM10027626]|uniref:sensor histidine kinase n=1 Tax=Paenibacillus sp. GCM10027626 TaxID=3273411 RepID=UPI00362A1960